eukprot:1625370-Ditylum_brightwellii.AAC.1
MKDGTELSNSILTPSQASTEHTPTNKSILKQLAPAIQSIKHSVEKVTSTSEEVLTEILAL